MKTYILQELALEIEVAIPSPVFHTFTYASSEAVPAGSRVIVPFGARKVIGVALGERKSSAGAVAERSFQLKDIHSLVDKTPIYSEVMLQMAKWMSRYYIYPLGEVLKTMLPAGAAKTTRKTYVLSARGLKHCERTEPGDDEILHLHVDFLRQAFKKRKQLSAAALLGHLKKGPPTVTLESLLAKRLITLTQSSKFSVRDVEEERESEAADVLATAPMAAAATPLSLTAEQSAVFAFTKERLLDNSEKRKPILIRGVTGSGKTEIYLQLIAENLQRQDLTDKGMPQALVLVPEISLTPQMTKFFSDRFPGQVAVVHSSMGQTQRWRELNRIRSGSANILIGPRSAIFAPFNQLSFIIVDEEHDSSYKQATGLTYNARDVAVLRGSLEKATVILGSATPSMESLRNAQLGRYELLQLHKRVLDRPLPDVQLVTTEPAYRQGVRIDHKMQLNDVAAVQIPIADDVLTALRENFLAKKQAIVLVHRRGYAYYLFSQQQKKSVSCPRCSISLTLHRRTQLLCCHYCDYKITTERILRDNPDDQFLAVGYGSEKMENFLAAALPEAQIARVDSEMSKDADMLNQTFADFRAGKLDILVGTQILAKGHDFPNVTLVVIVDVDQILDLPDFRAGERTFQLLVQAAGRAGRDVHAGKVLIQTSRPNNPIIRYALAQDFTRFAEAELQFRQKYNHPPASRLTLVEISSVDKRQLQTFCAQVERWLVMLGNMDQELKKAVKVQGPTLAPIETIRHRHRRFMMITGKQHEPVRSLLEKFAAAFPRPPADIRVKIDVDPMNLL